jgi:S-adenosylmethionine:tRNA ribosyltransferase-isomerase
MVSRRSSSSARGAEPSIPGTRVGDYAYDLPAERIARYPAARREESRLLVVSRAGGPPRDLYFRDLPELARPGDVLVVNETRVLAARLLGRKPTGAPAEILLLRPAGGAGDFDSAREWEALVRPGGKLKPGRVVRVADDLEVEIVDSSGGGRIVRLVTPLEVSEALERYGHMPLPPYIDRPDEVADRERYQTVYARTPGSVAAPTAGLHFSDRLLKLLELQGVERYAVTLDVGVGTFRPVEVEDPADHVMHEERFDVPDATAGAVNRASGEGRRIWAVGTTVVRTLESAAVGGEVRAGAGKTRLFVRPPYDFQVVDALITNFHLPRSTLLMLVAAFAGYERTMSAYGHAIEEDYRFYSYGDAMVVV